jgi:hypothetical protein
LWHGAGVGFIIWGLLHGVFLTINHGWRVAASRVWPDSQNYDRVMQPVGLVLTFVSVSTAMVFFRSPTVASAVELVKGLIGVNGVALPLDIFDVFGPAAGVLRSVGVIADPLWSGPVLVKTLAWISLLMFVALACPNTLQILARYEPALGVKPRSINLAFGRVEWNASLPWAIAVSAIAAISIISIGGPSEFLYWQF